MNGRAQILSPDINLSTLQDGRGLIASYIPNTPILEFVYQVTNAGKTRGHHFHPEFDEFVLYVEGEGVYIEKLDDGSDRYIPISSGICLYTPMGVYHTVEAVTTMKSISLLTKPWNSCTNPILKIQQ